MNVRFAGYYSPMRWCSVTACVDIRLPPNSKQGLAGAVPQQSIDSAFIGTMQRSNI